MRRRQALAMALIMLLLSGCWSRREITEVSFSAIMGVDWVEEEFRVSFNINLPKGGGAVGGGGGGDAEVIWTVSAAGRSLDEALSRTDQILPRSLTLAHVRSVIFGEELARRGIGPSLDFLLRSVEVRPTVWMGVTTGLAEDLLQARPTLQPAPAKGPLGNHDLAKTRTGYVPTRRLTNVTQILLEEGQDLMLPLFRLGDEEPPRPGGALPADPEASQEIIFGGAGLFRGDKLQSWLSPTEARAALWGRESVPGGLMAVPCEDPDRQILFRIRRGDGSVKIERANRQLRGKIQVRVIADVNEIGCREQLVTSYDLGPLEKLLAKHVKTEVLETVSLSKAVGADLFGFGRQLYRQSPPAFRQLEARWPEHLAEMPVEVQVQAIVPRLGQIAPKYHWKE